MDAVEFLKEKQRMCNTYPTCYRCQFFQDGSCTFTPEAHKPQEVVAIVEKWSKEHPLEDK